MPENAPKQEKGPYTLYRMDTHGNVFEIETKITEAFAKARIEALTANIHKQTYWYEIPKPKP